MQLLLYCALIVFLYMSIWAYIAVKNKRADIADIAWGLGFVLVSWSAFFIHGYSLVGLILNILVSIWGLRLSSHIYLRRRFQKEDFRYENMKKKWGSNINIYLIFNVFYLQGVILFIVSSPIVWIHLHAQEVEFSLLCFAAAIWTLGFLLESVADYQLAVFQKDPNQKGKILTTGLWSFVRHPNYLGEITQWWAIWMIASFLDYGWAFIVSPILLTYLIVFVSGVKPLEEKMKNHPDFPNYCQKVPSMLPDGFINAALYSLVWVLLVGFGPMFSSISILGIFLLFYCIQQYYFKRIDFRSFCISPILSVYCLILGTIQEIIFYKFDLIFYSDSKIPLWLLLIYPLFGQTLNSSLKWINKNLFFSFIIGFLGAYIAYATAEKMGSASIGTRVDHVFICLSFGLFLTVCALLNKQLNKLFEIYVDSNKVNSTLKVFFDIKCPICSREMKLIEKRDSSKVIQSFCPTSDEDIAKITVKFDYKQAMNEIHAIDEKGQIFKGIAALSEIYARTQWTILAILLQAFGFKLVFRGLYFVWAKIRPRFSR